MKFCKLMKDGGPLSRVWGFFFVEIKVLFSIVVLHFLDGSREAYHTHALHAISWLFKGKLTEYELGGPIRVYTPSFKPILTPRSMFHKVVSEGDTWAITFRGPWVGLWKEWLPETKQGITLTHGRKVVGEMPTC